MHKKNKHQKQGNIEIVGNSNKNNLVIVIF